MRDALWLLATAALLVAPGCTAPDDRPPELSRSQRRIVERRKMYGEDTAVGDKLYDASEDKWVQLPTPFDHDD